MPKLFSYVVDHDLGFAPNPFGGFCSLAKCKHGTIKCTNGTMKRNIVEMAQEGDWIAGTGGADLAKSAGHGKLIYAMRVDEKLQLGEYCRAMHGNRIDAEHEHDEKTRFALISHHYFYFGRNAINISAIPSRHLDHPFEKTGPGYRCDFSEEFINDFANWMKANFKVGVHGLPCMPHSDLKLPLCSTKVKRKGCKA
ncbi:MAG TPA: hypothetical protein VGP68_03960 [Gemmataceae bacterium]|jgi:hypothetical protein|nr:hypothetical protein [Gemmataceae bacterium]